MENHHNYRGVPLEIVPLLHYRDFVLRCPSDTYAKQNRDLPHLRASEPAPALRWGGN